MKSPDKSGLFAWYAGKKYRGKPSMPMVPGPLAAITLTAVKVGGYYLFADWINKRVEKRFSPLRFALIKTVIGFLLGTSLLVASIYLDSPEVSGYVLYAEMVVARMLVWLVLLAGCFGLHKRRQLWLSVTVLGTALTCVLDGLTFLLYEFMPGMQMGMC
ncbi:hypothetical protein KSF73_08035 [Burkholderiaceae bacterium DAT-1]|nr:hypothetical protein [Burkholderiaceae bacterium DAT-1]